jgi:hypothetical protein
MGEAALPIGVISLASVLPPCGQDEEVPEVSKRLISLFWVVFCVLAQASQCWAGVTFNGMEKTVGGQLVYAAASLVKDPHLVVLMLVTLIIAGRIAPIFTCAALSVGCLVGVVVCCLVLVSRPEAIFAEGFGLVLAAYGLPMIFQQFVMGNLYLLIGTVVFGVLFAYVYGILLEPAPPVARPQEKPFVPYKLRGVSSSATAQRVTARPRRVKPSFN